MSLIMDILHKTRTKTDTPVKPPPPQEPKKILQHADAVLSIPEETILEEPAFLGSHYPVSDTDPSAPEENTRPTIPHKPEKKQFIFILAAVSAAILIGLSAFLLWNFVFWRPLKTSQTVKPVPQTVTLSNVSTKAQSIEAAAVLDEMKPALEGLILDDEAPLCVIRGKILKIGDSLKGQTVKSIDLSGVMLVDEKGNSVFLKNPNS